MLLEILLDSLFHFVNLPLFRQQGASLNTSGCTGVNLPIYEDEVAFGDGNENENESSPLISSL